MSVATGQMANATSEILDVRPRDSRAPSPTICDMQSTSPIRRYVLLRQHGLGPAASRWSIERVAPSPAVADRTQSDAQATKPADPRA